MAKTFLLFVALLAVIRQTGSAAIIAPPLSIIVTASVTATFHCTTEGGALYWIINGTSRPSEWGEGISHDTRQSGTYQTSTLSIPATESRNNTLIRCAVNSIESGTVSLLIQGLLEAPSDVSVVSNYTIIRLNWQEPYTLDITGVEPDISHYQVIIKNVDNEQYIRVNTSLTSYSYNQQSFSTACATFEFQIAAVNLAGIGKRSAAVYGSFNIPPVLEASVSNDLQSVLLTCNASCSSDFILWFINNTILNYVGLNDVYYHETSNRNLNCFSSESSVEISIKLCYTEGLQVVPTGSYMYSATLSCAAIYACTREEINENCMPRMCYSAHEEVVSLVPSTEVFHTNSRTTNSHTDSEVTASEILLFTQEEQLNTLKHVIIGLGVVVALMLIITAVVTVMFIGAMIKWKRGNLRKTISSQVQETTVIYEEPKAALPQSTFDKMQQCPAYQITSQIRRS